MCNYCIGGTMRTDFVHEKGSKYGACIYHQRNKKQPIAMEVAHLEDRLFGPNPNQEGRVWRLDISTKWTLDEARQLRDQLQAAIARAELEAELTH